MWSKLQALPMSSPDNGDSRGGIGQSDVATFIAPPHSQPGRPGQQVAFSPARKLSRDRVLSGAPFDFVGGTNEMESAD